MPAAAHLAEQRPCSMPGRFEVAVDRGERGRPDVAGGPFALLIGLRGADEHRSAAAGVRFHVGAPERRNFADPGERVRHYPDDCRIAEALEAGGAVRGERGRRFRVRPADAGDLAAAPVPAFPPDAAQHVFAEAVRRGITEARHLVHLGDGGAGGAHGGRRGAARVARFEVVGDVGGSCRECLAPVVGGPCLPP